MWPFPLGNLHPSLSVFRDLLTKDSEDIQIKNREILEGIQSLCNRNNLVIGPSDKGGRILLPNKADYIRELEKIVSDYKTYQLMNKDPTYFKKEEETRSYP